MKTKLLLKTKMKKNKTAYEAALHLLKYRSQSTYELKKKLKLRKYEMKDIEEAIEKLQDYGYVNDESMAEDIFLRYKEMNAYGDIYIQHKIKMAGLSWDDHLTFDEEMEAAKHVMKVKLSLHPALERNYCKSASILFRRGFKPDVVRNILSELNIHDR